MSFSNPLGWLNFILPADTDVGSVTKDIVYGTDPRHKLDVYRPDNRGQSAPVLFFIYGGGWNSGRKEDYRFAGRAFAAAGFLTVIADYRLVPEVRFPAFLEDAGEALNWVVQNVAELGGDADTLFLMGHSAGAYNAVMMGLDGPRFGGPQLEKRLKGVVGLSGPYDFYPFDVPESIEAFAGVHKPELTQPVNLVRANMAPLQLLHGSKDKTCLPRNSRRLAARAQEVGGRVEAKFYPDMDHAGVLLSLFRPLRWRAPVYEDAVRFMWAEAGV